MIAPPDNTEPYWGHPGELPSNPNHALVLVSAAAKAVHLYWSSGERVPGNLSSQLFYWGHRLHAVETTRPGEIGCRTFTGPTTEQLLSIVEQLGCTTQLRAVMRRVQLGQRGVALRATMPYPRPPHVREVPDCLMDDIYEPLPLGGDTNERLPFLPFEG